MRPQMRHMLRKEAQMSNLRAVYSKATSSVASNGGLQTAVDGSRWMIEVVAESQFKLRFPFLLEVENTWRWIKSKSRGRYGTGARLYKYGVYTLSGGPI